MLLPLLTEATPEKTNIQNWNPKKTISLFNFTALPENFPIPSFSEVQPCSQSSADQKHSWS